MIIVSCSILIADIGVLAQRMLVYSFTTDGNGDMVPAMSLGSPGLLGMHTFAWLMGSLIVPG